MPHFTQTPTSFITYRPLPEAYFEFDIELAIKPLAPTGLIASYFKLHYVYKYKQFCHILQLYYLCCHYLTKTALFIKKFKLLAKNVISQGIKFNC